MKVDHIGVAVRDLKQGMDFYKNLFPVAKYEEIPYESGRMDIGMIVAENVKVELLCPWDETSAIGKFIAEHGEGIHHIAYEVPDIYKQMEKVEDLGIRRATEDPYIGAEGHLVFFMHTDDTNGVSYEFCQDH